MPESTEGVSEGVFRKSKRKDERPPDVGPNSNWWKHYKLWSTYLRRLSCLMTDTTALLPVAVLCRNRALEPDAVRPLYEQQVGFQYLPESVWRDCRVQDGKLHCRGMEFSAVIDPEQRFPDAPALPKDLSPLADLQCSPAAPQLRSAHFLRAGSECWFLVNEGNSGLHNAERIPVSEYKELYRGHEVACHTVLHPTIARSPLDQVAQQVLEDRRALEELVETPVRGLAYPNGS